MGWVKLEDGFFRHPKAIAAGRDGRLLFIAGLCYCGGGLTDGFIPEGALAMLAAETGIAKPGPARQALLETGLWERTEGGYRVHDYLEYNTSAHRVRTEREYARDRMRDKRSGDVRRNNTGTSGELLAKFEGSSENVRQPETEIETEKETDPARARARGSSFDRIKELTEAYRQGLGIPEDDAGWNTGGNVAAAAQADQVAGQAVSAEEIRGATAWLLDSWRYDGSRPIKSAKPKLLPHVVNAIPDWRADGSPAPTAVARRRREQTASRAAPANGARAPVPIRDTVIKTDDFEPF